MFGACFVMQFLESYLVLQEERECVALHKLSY